MSVLVEVTPEDIAGGKRGSCSLCPIALALDRRTKCAWNVGRRSASLVDGLFDVDLPYEATDFIDAFDRGGFVAPFSFWFPTVPHYAQEPVQ